MLVTILACAGLAASAVAAPPMYDIHRTGLFGAEQTGSTGYQFSRIEGMNALGQVVGTSSRVLDLNTFNGLNTWVYNPVTGNTTQTGLIGAEYTGSGAFQYGFNTNLNDAGRVAGVSWRVAGEKTFDGLHTWTYNPLTSTTVRTAAATR